MTVEKMTAIIAERVHTVRKLRGWSQRELAKRSELHRLDSQELLQAQAAELTAVA